MTLDENRARIISPMDSLHRVHTYYKGTPYHPDGRRVLCFRFASLDGGGQLCLIDREAGTETVLAEAEVHSYHTGADAYFCDGGRKVVYREKADCTAILDIASGEIRRLPGEPCNYCGHVDRHFIQVDAGFPRETQDEMGIYLCAIDGSRKRLLANVGDLLDAHPLGKAIRQAEILFRLGAEISPDQKRARLGLLTRRGGLLKEFYTCALDGELDLEFHGKLGSHPGWGGDSDAIYTFVKPWQTILGDLRDHLDRDDKGGVLGRYDLRTRTMTIMADYTIQGGSHTAPSPVANDVVMDEVQGNTLTILLFDGMSNTMAPILTEAYDPPELDRRIELIGAGDPSEKRYDVSAHPVFSPDGTKIVFNSCADGTLRLKEIDRDGARTT